MSDTETELEPETTTAVIKARQSRFGPKTKPAPDAALTEPEEHTLVLPAESAPTEPEVEASLPTTEPAAPTPTPRRRQHRPRSSGFPWERSPLAQFSMDALLAEIDGRRAQAARLQAERDRLRAQMATIEAELAAMGIAVGTGAERPAERTAPAARRSRARNSVTLADAIAMAVEPGATVSPAEAMQLVRSNGYVSNSRSFNVQVTNALSKDPRFRRTGRGQYERIAA